MAGDITTTITELLNNSDVLKSLRAEEAALAKVDAKAKALGTTRGKLLKAIKAEDAARDRAVMTELRAAAAAEKAANASTGYTATVQANTDATKQLGQGLGSLSQQFADVFVSIQGGQKPMTVLTQQGFQIADIFRMNAALAGKFAAALPVLGTAMAGVVAVGTPLLATYTALGDQSEILTTLTDQTSEALGTLADEVDRIVEAQKELDQREGVLSGLISEEQVRQTEAQAEATELYAGAIEQVKNNIRAYEKAIKDVEEDSRSFWSVFDLSQIFGGESAEDRIRGFKTAIKGLKENVSELEEESFTYAKRLEGVVEGEDKAAKAARKRTKAVDDGTASLRAYVTAIEDLQSVSGGAKDKPDANDDPTIRLLRQQVAEAKSAAAEITGLTVREANDRAAAVIEAEYKLSMQVQAIEAQAADESAQAAARAALRVVDEKLRIADEAARATLATDEELNELLAENARIAAEERAQIDAELNETIKNNYLDLMSKKWAADQAYINKRRDAEIRAAEASKAAWRSFASGTQTMLGNLASFTESAADEIGKTNEDAALRAYKITRAIKVVEATMGAYRIGEEFFEAAAKINPLLGPPAFAVGFGLAETAAVIPIRQQEPPSFNDTPSVQKMTGNRGLVSFAEGDYFAAAKDPEKLKQQVDKMQGGAKSEQVYGSLQPARFNDTPGVQRMGREQQAGGNFTISIPMKVNNRTAQNIVVQARASKVGYQIGQPIAGRRARKIGAR